MHVLRFTGTPTRYHFCTHAQTLGFEVDRDTYHGKDIVDFVAGGESDLALAVKDGFLCGQFTVSKSGTISGSITGGSASYRGDTGTIGGTAKPKAACVVITYHHGQPVIATSRLRSNVPRLDGESSVLYPYA